MGTRSLIGVRQQDGTILVSHVAYDGDTLGRLLRKNYDSALKATMLVSIGDLLIVGDTPAACTVSTTNAEACLASSFDEIKLANTEFFHLFENGRWRTTKSEERAWLDYQIEMERRGCSED